MSDAKDVMVEHKKVDVRKEVGSFVYKYLWVLFIAETAFILFGLGMLFAPIRCKL